MTSRDTTAPSPTTIFRAVTALVAALVLAVAPAWASPAAAQEPPGTLLLTNGFSTTDYSVWIDGSIEIDLERARAERTASLSPGSHTVEVYPSGGSPSTSSPILTRTVSIQSDGYRAIAVHPTASGTVASSIFSVDGSKTGSTEGRITVRHIAEAGTVDVDLSVSPDSQVSDGTTDAFSLSNGQQGVISDVTARENLIYELTVSTAGGDIVDTEVTIQPGEHLILNIVGNPPTLETAQDPASIAERILQVGALPPPEIWLVNGFTATSYDFYIGDELSRSEVSPLRRAGQLQKTPSTGDPLGAGTYTVNVYPKEVLPSSGPPVASIDITVCDGQSYDLALFPTPSGDETLKLFENDIRPVPSDSTRMTIRHIGQEGPVDWHIFPSGENAGVGGLDTVASMDHGEERVFDDIVINDYAMEIYNPGTTSGIITQNGDVEQEGGVNFVTYLMGSPPENNPNGKFMPGYGYEPPTTYTPAAPYTCGDGSGGGSGGSGGSGGGSGGSGGGTSGNDAVMTTTPARLVETRAGFETIDGVHQGTGQLATGSVTEFRIAGRDGIPSDAEAAVLNFAVTGSNQPGYITAYNCGDRPTAATVNFAAGETTSNATVVPLSAGGTICVFASTTTDVIVDANGYLPAGSPVDTVKPARLVDSRPATNTVDGLEQGGGQIPADGVREYQIAGRGGISADAGAAILNFAVTGSSEPGYITAYPCGDRPTAATVNYAAGETTSNSTIVDLSSSGTICVYAKSATDVVIDASGSVPDGAPVTTMSPKRLIETRPGFTTVDGLEQGEGALAGGEVREFQMTGRAGIPSDATGLIVNVAVTGSSQPGFVTLYKCGERPTAATVNFAAGETTSNATIVDLSSGGSVCVFASVATDVIVDASGYLAP